jgi:hypothetical protein
MKRLFLLTFFLISVSLAVCTYVGASPSNWARETTGPPSYAKWGRFAIGQVSQRYKAEIIDYLHVGRRNLSSNTAEEVFKFWVRDNDREFGVYVSIIFEVDTEKVLTVQFTETQR